MIDRIALYHARKLYRDNAARHGDARVENPVYRFCSQIVERNPTTSTICLLVSVLALLNRIIEATMTESGGLSGPSIHTTVLVMASTVVIATNISRQIGICQTMQRSIDRALTDHEPSSLRVSPERVILSLNIPQLVCCAILIAPIEEIVSGHFASKHEGTVIAVTLTMLAMAVYNAQLTYVCYISQYITGTPNQSRRNQRMPAGATENA